MEPDEYLKRPYGRLVVPDEDGSFTAEIFEFPGCIASGDTAAEALANLEEVAADWIAVTLAEGQDIPEPLDNAAYSGKFVLRMPKGLHKRAAQFAERDETSLNQFIVTCVAEHIGSRARPVPQFITPALVMQNILVIVPGRVASSADNSFLSSNRTLTVSPWERPYA